MMKLVALSALCAVTLAFVPMEHKSALETLTGAALVDYVNSAQSRFVTEHVDVPEEFMKSRAMDLKYAAPNSDEIRATEVNTVLASIPASFDARAQWPACKSMKLIHDQATCNSCWAFATAEVISDRICIETRGAQQPIISADDLLSCCGSYCGDGCEGGYPIQAFRWWNSKGVVTGGDYRGPGCKPYPFPPCSGNCPESSTPACWLSCQPGYSTSYANDKHYGASAYGIAKNVAAIQTEIMTNGPVEALFTLYEDFYKYHSGVYNHIAGRSLGGHAVKIIGWGAMNDGYPYWLVSNSWGVSWGERGFFRIHRGSDECGIEGGVVAGRPKF